MVSQGSAARSLHDSAGSRTIGLFGGCCFHGLVLPWTGTNARSPPSLVFTPTGDSRAVLCRNGKAIQLTDDHKPEREDEAVSSWRDVVCGGDKWNGLATSVYGFRVSAWAFQPTAAVVTSIPTFYVLQERVEKAGGQVLFWNGHRVMGVLAMSRAIGDHGLRPYIIPEPEVSVVCRTDDDDFLLLASDGLWDVMANQVRCHACARCGLIVDDSVCGSAAGSTGTCSTLSARWRLRADGMPVPGATFAHVQEATNLCIRCIKRAREKGASRNAAVRIAASVLTKAAIDRGSKDNVTVVIVDLRNDRPGAPQAACPGSGGSVPVDCPCAEAAAAEDKGGCTATPPPPHRTVGCC